MGIGEILHEYGKGFLHGARITVELAGLVWTLGILFGVALAVFQRRFPRLVGWPGKAVSFVITSVPVIVLLFWFHYPLQTLLGIQLDPFVTSVFTLSLVNVLAVADIVRPSLAGFPSGYIAAAQVAGLRPSQIFRRIQLPLIFRQVAPALLGLQVIMLQATIFASLISVNEVFRVAEQVNSKVYRPVQVYTALAVFFLLMCLPLNGAARALERKFRPELSIE